MAIASLFTCERGVGSWKYYNTIINSIKNQLPHPLALFQNKNTKLIALERLKRMSELSGNLKCR